MSEFISFPTRKRGPQHGLPFSIPQSHRKLSLLLSGIPASIGFQKNPRSSHGGPWVAPISGAEGPREPDRSSGSHHAMARDRLSVRFEVRFGEAR